LTCRVLSTGFCPSGKSLRFIGSLLSLSQAYSAKIFFFRFSEKYGHLSASRADEGRIAIVTDVARVAMDASRHMTSGGEADGEIVRSRSPDAGIKPRVTNAKRRWPEARRTEENTYKP
jgi:hypothetical protein